MVDYCGCLGDDEDEDDDGLIADAHLWSRSSRCDNIRDEFICEERVLLYSECVSGQQLCCLLVKSTLLFRYFVKYK